MTRGDVSRQPTSSARNNKQTAPLQRLAMSIPQFAEAHGISEGFYYKLKRQGRAPRELKLGSRTLITFESAAQWRAEREAASGAK
jgi:predicted DNA-binding transcriptional regulator AlpA